MIRVHHECAACGQMLCPGCSDACPRCHDLDDAEVIYRYTRAQAIEDGVLVDLGAHGVLVREAGVTVPVAMTATLFEAVVWPSSEESQQRLSSLGQSITGRLWDVLQLFRVTARAASGHSRVSFPVSVLDVDGRHRTVEVEAVIGPGDQGEPVLTLMLPGED